MFNGAGCSCVSVCVRGCHLGDICMVRSHSNRPCCQNPSLNFSTSTIGAAAISLAGFIMYSNKMQCFCLRPNGGTRGYVYIVYNATAVFEASSFIAVLWFDQMVQLSNESTLERPRDMLPVCMHEHGLIENPSVLNADTRTALLIAVERAAFINNSPIQTYNI